MSGFICPNCKKITEIFKSGGGEKMAEEMKVPFLGRIPLDSYVVESGENGSPLVLSNPAGETAQAFKRAVQPLIELSKKDTDPCIIEKFKELKVAKVGPSHCSGPEADKLFQEAYKENFIDVKVGEIIEV